MAKQQEQLSKRQRAKSILLAYTPGRDEDEPLRLQSTRLNLLKLFIPIIDELISDQKQWREMAAREGHSPATLADTDDTVNRLEVFKRKIFEDEDALYQTDTGAEASTT